MSQIYTQTAAMEGWQDILLAQDAMNVMWNSLIDKNTDEIKRIKSRLLSVAEYEADYKYATSHFSEFFLTCVDLTTDYILGRDNCEVAIMAIYDLIISYFSYHEFGYFDFGDDDRKIVVNTKVLESDLTKREIATQEHDIGLLSTVGADLPTVATIKRNSENNRILIQWN